MSYRQMNSFAGLITEMYFSNPKRFTFERDEFPGPGGGTTICTDNNDQPVVCRATASGTETRDYDLTDAEFTNFVLGTSQTLAERAAAFPTPDFVQIRVGLEIQSSGGQIACSEDGCGDDEDAGLEWIVDCPLGEYPFGVSETQLDAGGSPVVVEYESELLFLPNGSDSGTDNTLDALLRRPADGLTYDGEPDNDGVDTLIPWSVFLASPTIDLGMVIGPVHDCEMAVTSLTMTPWYVLNLPEEGTGSMCVL